MRRRPGGGLVVRPNHARVCDDRVPHRLAWPGLPVTSAVNFDWECGLDGGLCATTRPDAPVRLVAIRRSF